MQTSARIEDVEELLRFAEEHGISDRVLRAAALFIEEHVGAVNPRKLDAIRRRRAIREAGCTDVRALMERFGVSRVTVYRALESGDVSGS